MFGGCALFAVHRSSARMRVRVRACRAPWSPGGRRLDGHAGVSLRCCRMLGVVSHYISFLCHLHAINAYSIKDTACMYKRI